MEWLLLLPRSIDLWSSKNLDLSSTSALIHGPELEYGRMNIGSRPSKRKPSGGIQSLRAIPWIFSWTQTRFHLPVWLGFRAAFKYDIKKDVRNLHMLQDMYKHWPFLRVNIDLIEMMFAKGDPGIAALYDKLLVSKDLWAFGEKLRTNFEETKSLVLQTAGHRDLLEGDPYLKQRLRLRDTYITTLNVCQAFTLKRIRDQNYSVTLRPHISKEIIFLLYTSSSSDKIEDLDGCSVPSSRRRSTVLLQSQSAGEAFWDCSSFFPVHGTQFSRCVKLDWNVEKNDQNCLDAIDRHVNSSEIPNELLNVLKEMKRDKAREVFRFVLNKAPDFISATKAVSLQASRLVLSLIKIATKLKTLSRRQRPSRHNPTISPRALHRLVKAEDLFSVNLKTCSRQRSRLVLGRTMGLISESGSHE
ncbi:hypothetical protein DY000_02043023 [Brassica cretica]|uniref:Phosphoenolpyruvate carboxylase n=1 Tax=Brassica cretica TaxID=69181 RepID=A0ABQ7BQ45_BRACR|nr:hypothetical protein DY000_02043023 [Brassica cretica]